MSRRPGGELASRPLHFIWIADSSGSMEQDGKIQSLNTAIREAIPHMKKVAEDNPNAQVLVRAVKFSNGAQWHISQPTPVADFAWNDLAAEGETDMGKALQLVAEQLKMPPMSERALPPVLVLVSDGQPTDDFEAGLKALMNEPWGKKAVRIAISIGRDADADVLQKFIGNSELKPLAANSPEALVRHIKWASTAVLKSASSPAAGADTPATGTTPVPIPTAAPAAATDAAQAAAAPGAPHLRAGLPNQDAILQVRESGRGLPLVVSVSDGHGSHKCFRSHRGSRFAVRKAAQLVGEFLDERRGAFDEEEIARALKETVPREFVRRWREAVEADLKARPFAAEELEALERKDGAGARKLVEENPLLAYGATSLTVAVEESFILYLQLGDGEILCVSDDGRVTRALPEDARLF